MRIEKKTWPDFFEKILSGEKQFDLRIADWNRKVGDILVLKEWDPKTKRYTGRKVEKKVGFVIKVKEMEKFHTKEEIKKYDLQVIGFK